MLIGKLSEQTGVSRRALRYYEEQGLLIPGRTCSGYRVYSDDAPLIVAQIQGLYAAGLDSDAIRQYLPCARGRTPDLEMCAELRTHLNGRAAELDTQLETISRQRQAILAHLS
ncbi:MerR family transcriptional regulator [Arthrobacter sp. ISL-65]|uniref:MerR family transcriptional regulator n=1 Tax=Arthrobacter sp. ISL-65 TaxID=2819112 RepID=UPI001BEA1A28|nr:MerR family transcriptional regulator [Arthrobacter sp. ISL-65]MBT2548967.1 MerR family transcriptional regulator [Arthrobacter sp. ISL-65]